MGARPARRRRCGSTSTQVHARKDKIVKGLTGGIELLFKKNKIEWIKGSGAPARQGRDRGDRRGRAGAEADREGDHRRDRLVGAQRAGHRDRSEAHHHERRSASTCRRCRSRSSMMGSGAVGVEFASIFNRFGSQVTLIELLPRIVPLEDEAVSAELERSRSRRRKIKVLTGTKVTSAKPGRRGRDHRGADCRTARPRS